MPTGWPVSTSPPLRIRREEPTKGDMDDDAKAILAGQALIRKALRGRAHWPSEVKRRCDDGLP